MVLSRCWMRVVLGSCHSSRGGRPGMLIIMCGSSTIPPLPSRPRHNLYHGRDVEVRMEIQGRRCEYVWAAEMADAHSLFSMCLCCCVNTVGLQVQVLTNGRRAFFADRRGRGGGGAGAGQQRAKAAPTNDRPRLDTAGSASAASDKTAPPPARHFPDMRDPPAEEEQEASTSDPAAPNGPSRSTGFLKVRGPAIMLPPLTGQSTA